MSDAEAEKSKKQNDLKEAKMRMMMLVGDLGKAQAAVKADPANKTLPRQVGDLMKQMTESKARVAELEKVCFVALGGVEGQN